MPPKKAYTPPPPPLPTPEIKGQLTARRGLEIAMVGGHSVLLIGPAGSGRNFLAQSFPRVRATVLPSCPCGHLRSAATACTCTESTLAVYKAILGPVLHEAAIALEVCELPAKYWAAPGMQAIDWERLYARVKRGQALIDAAQSFDLVDEVAQRTRELAIRRLSLSCQAYVHMMAVARTIAALDGASGIMAKHLAEAVQYCPLVVTGQWWEPARHY